MKAHIDSQIVVNHMLGKYEAKEKRMKKYLEEARHLQWLFSYFQLVRIPRSQNTQADTLRKLAYAPMTSPVEEIQMRSIEEAEVRVIVKDCPNWMTPLRNYMEKNELPEDKSEAMKILSKSLWYALQEGVL